MAVRGMYDTVRQAFQDIIAPQIEGLKGEITAVRTKVDSLEKRMEERFGSLEKQVEESFAAVRTEISYTNRRLDEALEIRERLASLEAKIAASR